MYHTVFVWCQLYKCAEVHDTYYLAGKYHSSFDISNNSCNNSDSAVDHSLVSTANIYNTFITDVDLNAGLFDDLVDYLALLSYHITDLLRINGDLLDLWSILA